MRTHTPADKTRVDLLIPGRPSPMQGFSIRTLECWLASWQGASLLQRGLSVGHVGKFLPARMPSLLGTALDNDTPKRSEEKMRAEDRTRQPGRAVDWAGKLSIKRESTQAYMMTTLAYLFARRPTFQQQGLGQRESRLPGRPHGAQGCLRRTAGFL